MTGYISLHRKIKDNILFKETRVYSKFEAWLDILMDCNFKENEFLLGYEVIKIEIGSYVTSKQKLYRKYNWSRKKLDNFLNLLLQQGMIKIKTVGKGTHKGTQLYVLNYSKYQNNELTKDTKRTSLGTNSDIQGTTTNKVNNNNKDNNNILSKDKKEELDRFIKHWNNVFKEKRQVTKDLLIAYKNLRSKYSFDDFKIGFSAYCKDKVKSEKQYRLSPMGFLTYKKGLPAYL